MKIRPGFEIFWSEKGFTIHVYALIRSLIRGNCIENVAFFMIEKSRIVILYTERVEISEIIIF